MDVTRITRQMIRQLNSHDIYIQLSSNINYAQVISQRETLPCVIVLTKSKLSHKVFIPRRTRWTASRRARISSDCVEVLRCVVLIVVPVVVIVILVVLHYIRHVVEPPGRSWLMLRCHHVIIASWTRIVDSDVSIVRISDTSDTNIVRSSVKVVSHPGLWGIVSLPCLQSIYMRNDWAAVLLL